MKVTSSETFSKGSFNLLTHHGFGSLRTVGFLIILSLNCSTTWGVNFVVRVKGSTKVQYQGKWLKLNLIKLTATSATAVNFPHFRRHLGYVLC